MTLTIILDHTQDADWEHEQGEGSALGFELGKAQKINQGGHNNDASANADHATQDACSQPGGQEDEGLFVYPYGVLFVCSFSRLEGIPVKMTASWMIW